VWQADHTCSLDVSREQEGELKWELAEEEPHRCYGGDFSALLPWCNSLPLCTRESSPVRKPHRREET